MTPSSLIQTWAPSPPSSARCGRATSTGSRTVAPTPAADAARGTQLSPARSPSRCATRRRAAPRPAPSSAVRPSAKAPRLRPSPAAAAEREPSDVETGSRRRRSAQSPLAGDQARDQSCRRSAIAAIRDRRQAMPDLSKGPRSVCRGPTAEWRLRAIAARRPTIRHPPMAESTHPGRARGERRTDQRRWEMDLSPAPKLARDAKRAGSAKPSLERGGEVTYARRGTSPPRCLKREPCRRPIPWQHDAAPGTTTAPAGISSDDRRRRGRHARGRDRRRESRG